MTGGRSLQEIKVYKNMESAGRVATGLSQKRKGKKLKISNFRKYKSKFNLKWVSRSAPPTTVTIPFIVMLSCQGPTTREQQKP